MAKSERAPLALGAPGRRIWQQVAAGYVLTPAERVILEQACRTADELAVVEKVVRELDPSELIVVGSTGQPRAHPLLEEARRHRELLEKLCKALHLPDESTRPVAQGAPAPAPSELPRKGGGPRGRTSHTAG